MAVALGVGTAVFAGHGVASADSGSESTTSPTSATSSAADRNDSQGKRGTKTEAELGPRAPGGRHHADDTTEPSTRATSVVDRLSKKVQTAAENRKARLTRPDRDDDVASEPTDETTTPKAKRPKTRERIRDAVDAAVKDVAESIAEVAADQKPVDTDTEPRIAEWLSHPRVTAGRTEKPAPPEPAVLSNPLSDVVNDAIAVLAGQSARTMPSAPAAPVGTPAELLLLAGVRRELSAQAAADAPYTIGVDQGVIGGCVVSGCPTTSDGLPLTYTVIGDPSNGGKVAVDTGDGSFTFLPFAPETSSPSGTESFTVLVSQNTEFSVALTSVPLVGSAVFAPTIVTLQQVPVVNVVLAPVIGTGTVQTVVADIDVLRGPTNTPIAFTTMVTSFDGSKISANFFPAIGSPSGDDGTYPTVFYGPGLGSPGVTNPSEAMISSVRGDGYNVVTWDPRGIGASGGILQLDSPFYEGRDVSALISWAADRDGVALDAADDPRMGMVGGSYGGGIQLVTAAIDHRVDAIVPQIAWNNLNDALYPDGAFKTGWSALLLLGLVTGGADINPEIYGGIVNGALLGILTEPQQALLAASGPGILVSNIEAPTLIIQGTPDGLFTLQQAIINAQLLSADTAGHEPVPVKMIWYCGGHGTCDTLDQAEQLEQNAFVTAETLDWLDTYVKNTTDDPEMPGPAFQWVDQNGDYWTSDTLPSAPDFYSDALTSTGAGGLLPIVPVIGGSGSFDLLTLGDGSPADNAVNVALTPPEETTHVVGSPQVTMTYSGIGTSRHVYAQVVDKKTGLVVGNLVTPIPVTLDGKEHTVTVDLAPIAYTMDADSELEVQIVSSAVPYLNLTQFGAIDISAVEVGLPTAAQANASTGSQQDEDLISA